MIQPGDVLFIDFAIKIQTIRGFLANSFYGDTIRSKKKNQETYFLPKTKFRIQVRNKKYENKGFRS